MSSRKPYSVLMSDDEQVVIKIDELQPIDVAMHPYLDASMAYVTITRGADHTLTVVKRDGSRMASWTWTARRAPKVEGNAKRLLEAMCDECEKSGVCIEVPSASKPSSCNVFLNPNIDTWQARIIFLGGRYSQLITFPKATSEDDVVSSLLSDYRFEFDPEPTLSTAPSGIDVWSLRAR